MRQLSLCLFLCCAGCSAGKAPPASLSETPESAVAAPRVKSPLRRLLESPAEEGLTITEGADGEIDVRPIHNPEDLASDGRRYTLYVNRSADIAWIQIDGGFGDHIHDTAGPWRLAHPHVAALLAGGDETQ